MATFIKAPGAAAGTIRISSGPYNWIIDDASNASIISTNPTEIRALRQKEILAETSTSASFSVSRPRKSGRVPYGTFTGVLNFGHSLAAGNNATSGYGYSARVAQFLRRPLLTQALGGSIACYDDPSGANCGWSRIAQYLNHLANPTGKTTIASGSNGAALPQGTINVASTAGAPSRGRAWVVTAGGAAEVQYSGITATSILNCSGGTGTMATAQVVYFLDTVDTSYPNHMKGHSQLGSTDLQAAYPWLPWPYGRNPLTLMNLGFNDLTAESGTPAIPKLAMAIRYALSHICASCFIEGLSYHKADGSAVGTGWSAPASTSRNGGVAYWRTGQNGDYLDYQTNSTFHKLHPGSHVAFHGQSEQGKSATVKVYVDGVLNQTILAQDYAPAAAGKVNGWCIRIPVGTGAGEITPYTQHTFKIEFTAMTVANAGLFNHIAYEAGPQPVVQVMEIFKPRSTSVYFGSDLADRDSIITAANSALQSIVEEEFQYTNKPKNVRWVEYSDALGKSAAYYLDNPTGYGTAGDGLHINDEGHALITGILMDDLLDWYDQDRDYAYEARS